MQVLSLQLEAANCFLCIIAVPAVWPGHSEKRPACTVPSACADQPITRSSKPHQLSSFGLILEPPGSCSLQVSSLLLNPLFLNYPFSPTSACDFVVTDTHVSVFMTCHKGLPQLLSQVSQCQQVWRGEWVEDGSPWMGDIPVIITVSSAAGILPLSLVFICRASQPSQHQGPSAVSACVLCLTLPRHVLLSPELTRGKANVQSPGTSHPLIGGDRQHSQAGRRVLLPWEGVTAIQGTRKRWAGISQKESHHPNAQVLPLHSSGRHLLG